ncbi:hypothetical protein F5Y16DRAFT_414549 [Xylariaceae sp. FL0255]|nr:hypothetical protein F5Y16DRAFT_414549 [Xylariaceae sp. FL0255]
MSQHTARRKQRLIHPLRPPPAFWENLSEIPLTRSALQLLDRRNTETSSRRLTAEQYLNHLNPDELKQIKSFTRHGGPDLTTLRGPSMDPTRSSLGRQNGPSITLPKRAPTSKTTSTRNTGPYDRVFQQHLINYGIYPDGFQYPDGQFPPEPVNLDDIDQVPAQPRRSLSLSRFSKHDLLRFKQANANALKEAEVMSGVLPIIKRDIKNDEICMSGHILFKSLDHLTDGSLVPGNPDRYYGARPEQLDQQVWRKLCGHIVLSTQHEAPILPNFFLEVKGPDGSSAVAARQACYDGALGTRGMQSLHLYLVSDPVFNNKAYTITSTYHDGTLKIYTVHPLPQARPGIQYKYITTRIKAYALTSNVDTFKVGAKRKRDEAIEETNKKVRQSRQSPLTPEDLKLSSSFIDKLA